MKTSTDRILTTHTGSLPRPQPLVDIILGREKGDAIDATTFENATAKAIEDRVARQAAAGIEGVGDVGIIGVILAQHGRNTALGVVGAARGFAALGDDGYL